jgi:ABC-2 type transport system ATP-binding protein
MLQCQGLTKRFGKRTAVHGLTVHVGAGEAYGLLGPNGAGKTTTISMICGLLDADSGEVVVDGKTMSRRAVRARRAIGYVPQEVALWGGLTARENLKFFGRFYGLKGKALKEAVAGALEQVGLAERADDKLDSFSGGMKRRANIAVALLHSPKLLVLDEPTVGVDTQSRHAILDRIGELRDAGTAVLFASHYIEEVEHLCDRVGILEEGRLMAEGSPRELVARLGQSTEIHLTAGGVPTVSLVELCRSLPGVTEATLVGETLRVIGTDGGRLLPLILTEAGRSGTAISSVRFVEPDLEAVFLQMTGRALRD